MQTTVVAKTPETLTIAARRALGTSPLQYALSANAVRVLEAVRIAVQEIHRTPWGTRPDRQRFIDIWQVRVMLDMHAGAVDRALNELADLYLISLHVPWSGTTVEQDNGALRRYGADYHQVSSDRLGDWG